MGIFFVQKIFFRTTQELEYLFFLSNLTLGYMTKTESDFFFLHQNQNIFLEKNHNPPFKLNGRSLIVHHPPAEVSVIVIKM
jgi:preprotein translocase subunit SecG